MRLKSVFVLPLVGLLIGGSLLAQDPPRPPGPRAATPDQAVQGLYKAVLQHEGTNFYQVAHVTLRTTNPGTGQLKISANVRLFFGDATSTEFLTYEFDDCPMNLLTRQITIKSEKNDVSFIGYLRTGSLEGEWYSTILGRVGKFAAAKGADPAAPEQGVLIKTLTGHYRGSLTKIGSSDANLPERASISLVTTQDTSGTQPTIKISGNMRLYVGDFGSIEYEEAKFTDVQYNFYNRYLTAKTDRFGLTLKGTVSQDGTFTGTVFADGYGEVSKAELKRQ